MARSSSMTSTFRKTAQVSTSAAARTRPSRSPAISMGGQLTGRQARQLWRERLHQMGRSPMLMTPVSFSAEQRENLRRSWKEAFSGDNAHRMVVLEPGVAYHPHAGYNGFIPVP